MDDSRRVIGEVDASRESIDSLHGALDGPSCLSYERIMIGITRCKYSSMLAPNVKKASSTFICVACFFSCKSPSKLRNIRGSAVDKNGLNSPPNAFPGDSMRPTIGNCTAVLSQSS